MFKYDFYDRVRGKRKKAYLNRMYANYMLMLGANQFKYETPSFNKTNYESAIMSGISAFYQCNVKSSVNYKEWCCTPIEPATVLNNEGLPTRVTTHGSDYAMTMDVGNECILVSNNSAHAPETYFTVIADLLAETDTSTKALVKWSRMCPIPKVTTDEEIEKYVSAMKRVLDGEEITVISDNSKLLGNEHSTIDDNVLRLTDEKAIDKMHFYSEFYENLIKRACTLRGVPFAQNSKSSQSLTDELHDMDIFSLLYITDCYEQRKKDFTKCEEFMRGKGVEFSFGFDWSDIMKMQIEKIKALNEKPILENEQMEKQTEQPEEKPEKGESEGKDNGKTDDGKKSIDT